MDKVYVKGQKLFITTEDATFDGTFHCMDAEKTRLTVKNVVKHPNEESFDGFYHFYKNEIVSVQILDPISSTYLSPGSEPVSSKFSTIMKGCQSSPSYYSRRSYLSDFGLPNDQYKYYSNLLKRFVIIDEIGSEFHNAIKDIKTCNLVGCSFGGTMFGRKGKLSWICFSVPYKEEGEEEPRFIQLVSSHKNKVPERVTVYLFDLAVIGNPAISEGLGDILSCNASPLKVIYDCRLPSDCLYHQYDLKLRNVADLQVAQLLFFPKKIRYPEDKNCDTIVYTKGLHVVLTAGLNLPSNLVYIPHIDDGYLQREKDVWYQRPITPLMAKAAAYQTMYLYNLWAKVYLKEFRKTYFTGLYIYLTSVRDADDETAFILANQYHMAPKEFVPLILESIKMKGNLQKSKELQDNSGDIRKNIKKVRGTSIRES